MSKEVFPFTRHYGGQATSLKQGVKHSFGYSRHIDFRKDPAGLSILPAAVKETDTVVTGLITDMLQLPSGKMVAIDSSGGVYTRATNGTWTKDDVTLSSTAAGMHYVRQQDTIYIPGLHNLHSITDADGRFSGGEFTVNESAIGANVDQSATSSSASYTTPSSIVEGPTHRLSFVPTIEPMYSVKIWVTTKGTGAVTVTMHDAANNTLATVTKTAAQLTAGQLNEFIFTTPVTTTVKPNASTYHFHVTYNTSGTASILGTGTSSDLSAGRYETWVNRFVNPTNGWHPAHGFLNFGLFGNGRYVAVWEAISQSDPANTEFLRHRVVLEPEHEVTSFANWTEYVAIGAEKRSTSPTNEFQEGRIYFWDGTAPNWNFAVDIPEGAPYSLHSHKNVLHYFAGNSWWAWAGNQPVELFKMPRTDFEFTSEETYTINNPHMMGIRNSILLGGFPSETNSSSIEHGVYSFGARDKNYSSAFGYSYTISTGNRTNGTLRIGMVKCFGDKTFIAWRDGNDYGVDLVDPSSGPSTTAVWESLIMDFGRPDKTKGAVQLEITFEPLPTGATVTPKYKIDREASWQTTSTAVASETNATTVKMNINKRFKEIQFGMDLTATDTTPKIISINLTVESLAAEAD
jgi:hypothetical protein